MAKKQISNIGIDEVGMAAGRGKPRPAFIIGIDEAGRGPLAGPVVVAGIKIPAATSLKLKVKSLKLRDSKKLTAKQREEWFKTLKNHPEIEWAAAKVWPKTIDRINIARAVNLGVRRVYARLCRSKSGFGEKKPGLERITTLLDGSLKLPSHIPHQVIIKGDEKIPMISAASIIAKVLRDRVMMRLHKKYPQYGFDKHKGYGTKLHMEMLIKYGRCKMHRISFAKSL